MIDHPSPARSYTIFSVNARRAGTGFLTTEKNTDGLGRCFLDLRSAKRSGRSAWPKFYCFVIWIEYNFIRSEMYMTPEATVGVVKIADE